MWKLFFSLSFISMLLTELDKFLVDLISLYMFLSLLLNILLLLWQYEFQQFDKTRSKLLHHCLQIFSFHLFDFYFSNLYFWMPDNTIFNTNATSAARRDLVANVRRIRFAPSIYLVLLFLIWSSEYSFKVFFRLFR